MNNVRLIIFAKAPSSGMSKTRLIPALGEYGAAKLAKQLLLNTINNALLSPIESIELRVFPNPASSQWQEDDVFTLINTMSKNAGKKIVWSEQCDGDLGARLMHAAERSTQKGEHVLLIGTDCPSLTPDVLKRAHDELMLSDAVIHPASDGGYTLLGLQSVQASIFENIAWSTPTVFSQTIDSMKKLGWRIHELPVLHDIDEPDDLQWLPNDWPDRELYFRSHY